jgi:hypothetical protein
VITGFADQAVILPSAAATLGVFVSMQWWRGAIAWIGIVGATLVRLLKLRFFACNLVVPRELIGNASCHTAGAAVVYGGLVVLMARSIWDSKCGLIPVSIAISTLIAAVIGETRLQLDQHSKMEVLVGGGIGTFGAISFAVLAGPPTVNLRVGRLLFLALLVIALFYGG